MLTLELRWVLFALLAVLVAVIALVVWLYRRRGAAALDTAQSWAALEHAPFGLLVLDSSGVCRYANPQARHLLGLGTLPGPLPQDEWVALLERDRAAARRQGTTIGRYGSVPLSECEVRWWVTPWQDQDVVFVLDITAHRRAEQAASRLLSDLSHELRTPLATILTHMEILLLSDVSEEVRQRSLHLLKAEARRMARLVNDMLELGRLETSAEVERRPVDLLALAEQAIAQVAPQAEGRQIRLSLQADTPLPLVEGDRDRMRQVLLNLLDNAIKYGEPGDQIEIALHDRQADGTVACSVRDTGPGIPAEHLSRIPGRFYRAASREVEGSGLGLVLVQEILRHHQSELTIESHTEGPEKGTCAQFALPALPGEGVSR